MSTFGTIFRVTTFGESHCKGVGCIIDGVPPRMMLTEADIQPQLTRRRPGQSVLTTPRDEADKVEIISGTERGITLGTPVALMVHNRNVRPRDYAEMAQVPRPGHADYTYQMKYGIRASSGGGRSSARETIGRVAAGAIAEKWLAQTHGIRVVSFVGSVGNVELPADGYQNADGTPWSREQVDELGALRILRDPVKHKWSRVPVASGSEEGEEADPAAAKAEQEAAQKAVDDGAEALFLENRPEDADLACYEGKDGLVYTRDGTVLEGCSEEQLKSMRTDNQLAVRCPHGPTACKMASLIRQVKSEKDSIGGTVVGVCTNVPVGWGEPCFDKLEAKMAHAMLSLPATKGFSTGSGFEGTRLRGSEHNDLFVPKPGMAGAATELSTLTNNAGGTLGGISSGGNLVFKVAVKPVSTIGRAQETATYQGAKTTLEAKGRHDPCVLPRTPPLVEGMAALVLMDAALLQKTREHQGIVDESRFMTRVPLSAPKGPGADGLSSPPAEDDERPAKVQRKA